MKQRSFTPGTGHSLEQLESRKLLSAAVVSHPAAAAAKVVMIGGQIAGTAFPYANAKLPLYNTLLSGTGTAAGLGKVLLGGYETSSLKGSTASIANGKVSFAFPAAKNTYLNVNFAGSGPVNFIKANSTLTLKGTITGGGGVFAGVTGTFSATVTVSAANRGFVLKYTFAITPHR